MVALPLGQKIFRHTASKGAAAHDAGTGSGDPGRFPLLYSAKADGRGAIRVFSLSLMEAAQVRQRFRTGDEGECGLGRFGHQDRAAVETEPGSDVFRIQSGRQPDRGLVIAQRKGQGRQFRAQPGRQFIRSGIRRAGHENMRLGRPGQRGKGQTEHLLCLSHRICPRQAGTLLIAHWSSPRTKVKKLTFVPAASRAAAFLFSSMACSRQGRSFSSSNAA